MGATEAGLTVMERTFDRITVVIAVPCTVPAAVLALCPQ
jgi:hypothetical protein